MSEEEVREGAEENLPEPTDMCGVQSVNVALS
jgi:hypothetical protein